jgi:hypothetical protein
VESEGGTLGPVEFGGSFMMIFEWKTMLSDGTNQVKPGDGLTLIASAINALVSRAASWVAKTENQ